MTRRLGAAGVRRGVRSASEGAAPIAADSIDALWAGFAHASLSDAQQLDIESRLMALMGITP